MQQPGRDGCIAEGMHLSAPTRYISVAICVRLGYNVEFRVQILVQHQQHALQLRVGQGTSYDPECHSWRRQRPRQ